MKKNRWRGVFTPQRAAVLEELVGQPDPVRIEALAARTGRHPNTLREQLNWLVEAGLAVRHRRPGEGRGRPAWVYQAAGPRQTPSEYAGLAAALAWSVAEASPEPAVQARTAGRAWGEQLCRDRGAVAAGSARTGRSRTVELLAELGYGPEPDARMDRVSLTRCPLLQVAYQHQEVVCAVHLGMVEAVLSGHGADSSRTTLTPFATPGTCRLRLLAPRPPTGSEPSAT